MSRPAAGTMPAPIYILTNERDFAADWVIRHIQDLGGDIERLNTESSVSVRWLPTDEPVTAKASAVWLRQFLADPTPVEKVQEVDDFLVQREQWRAWLTDLAEGENVRWMNPLWAARRAENKLIQLRTALAVGLSVPATVVTNTRADAREHQQIAGPCIVKAVAAGYFPFSTSAFMFTRNLDDALEFSDAEWAAQPVIVQRQIEPRRDLRIFVVDQFSAAVSTKVDSVDWRTRSADAEWSRSSPPPSLVQRCRSFLRELGLTYGAFDFAYDDNNYWFLECNQAGEFLFVDRPLELGVGEAVARWLCGGSC